MAVDRTTCLTSIPKRASFILTRVNIGLRRIFPQARYARIEHSACVLLALVPAVKWIGGILGTLRPAAVAKRAGIILAGIDGIARRIISQGSYALLKHPNGILFALPLTIVVGQGRLHTREYQVEFLILEYRCKKASRKAGVGPFLGRS